MSSDAVTRLQKVLELEQKYGYRNRAVLGGLEAMAARWVEDARKEQVDGALVQRVEPLMVAYGSADADRQALIEALLATLGGDYGAADKVLGSASASAQRDTRDERGADATPPQQPRDDAPLNFDDAGAKRPDTRQQHSAESRPLAAAENRPPASAKAARTTAPPPQKQTQKAGKGAKGKQPQQPQVRPEDAPVLGATYVFEYEGGPRPSAARTERSSNRPARSPADLAASPLILQGVGPSINEHLQKLGIEQVRDLLWHLPMRYDDFSRMRKISELQPGDQATVLANVWEVHERKMGFNRSLVEAVVSDGTGTLSVKWWNKWVIKELTIGATLRLSGKVGLYMGKKTLENPVFEDADTETLATGRIAPVYPLTEGISQKKLRQLTHQVLEDFAHFVADPMPAHILADYGLLDLQTALWQIHFPDDDLRRDAARRRLSFDEFLYIQLGVLQRRRELQGATAPVFAADDALLAQYIESLPFTLTGAQLRVLDETRADMARSIPMTRLVQGDVGSGKTAVAAGAMWLAAAQGAQAAMLAPTQILAEQHARALARLLAGVAGGDGAPPEVALLTGRVTGAERARVLDGLRAGTIPIVVGTTALIQEGVEFANLGVVVVDEQHRFGVEQRGALRTRAELQPHMLVMSATPIPRSLALTLYGDLDVSRLDEMPAGRLPVKTVLFRPNERERVYGFLQKESAEGKQAFIVYPLVEESEVLNAGSATEAYERLQREVFPNLRLALLHGQMKGSEKDAIMSAFAAGEYDILVSTSVIEVGIDVPNATVIVIEDAERFGLAQLHQFRGRVGRGDQRSFCVLVSRATGEAAEERLSILASTNDGFVLAEKDLELRGPGDFLGTRQTGLPELQIALFSDVTTLMQARDAADALLQQDAELANYPALAEGMSRFWRGHGDIS